MAKKEESIVLQEIKPQKARITIVGDSDLICNKINDVSARQLIDQRKDKAKKATVKENEFEKMVTAIHWLYPIKGMEFDETTMDKLLECNCPCISSFGFLKSFGDAVVRFGIDTYATKFKAGVNIVDNGGLIPFKFKEHFCDEKLMSPKKGAPVLTYLNRFTGWEATIEINYVDAIYSLEQIVNVVNLAGFGIGIGSGRSSGYGRYHVTSVERMNFV